jgi:hypothetical protein
MTIDQFKQIISMMGFSPGTGWDFEVFQNCTSDLNADAWVYFGAPIETQRANDSVYFIDGDTVDFAHFYRWLMENDQNDADLARQAWRDGEYG